MEWNLEGDSEGNLEGYFERDFERDLTFGDLGLGWARTRDFRLVNTAGFVALQPTKTNLVPLFKCLYLQQ